MAYAQSATGPDQKPVESDLIVATVWPNGYSEVKWTCGTNTYGVVSNIDFRVFPGTVTVDTTFKTFFSMVIATSLSQADVTNLQSSGALDNRNLPPSWPATLPAIGGVPQYVAIGDNPPAAGDAGWQVMQALHTYFQAHSVQIIYAAQQRQANPPVTPVPAPAPPLTQSPVVFKRIEHRLSN